MFLNFEFKEALLAIRNNDRFRPAERCYL